MVTGFEGIGQSDVLWFAAWASIAILILTWAGVFTRWMKGKPSPTHTYTAHRLIKQQLDDPKFGLIGDIMETKYIGREIINGRPVFHMIYRIQDSQGKVHELPVDSDEIEPANPEAYLGLPGGVWRRSHSPIHIEAKALQEAIKGLEEENKTLREQNLRIREDAKKELQFWGDEMEALRKKLGPTAVGHKTAD